MLRKRKGRGYRANHEGGLSQRKDGRWDASITVYTLDGPKRIRTTRRTRAEADRWLTEHKSKRNMGFAPDVGNITFGEYLERWLEDGVKGSVKNSTYLVHRTHVRRHLTPALGSVRLNRLRADHFQALYREKLKTLSAQTVVGIHATARKALQQAIRWDLIPHGKNAAGNAKPPRPKKKEVESLSRKEARRLLEASRGHRLHAMYALALAGGIRHGELLALRWDDVTFRNDKAEIAVRRTVSRDIPIREGGKSSAVGDTKTGKGRVVHVGAGVAALLREHRKKQNEERLALGPAWQESGHVFTKTNGRVLSERESSRYFSLAKREAGMEHVHFHMLRHTAATMAGEGGAHPKTVADMLGHASVMQTLNTYSHVFKGAHETLADKLDEELF
jgi:integrase